jgi:hypothetical protein
MKTIIIEGWPQVLFVIYTVAELGGSIAKHGELKTGTHNAWITFTFFTLIYSLLIFGGFFS